MKKELIKSTTNKHYVFCYGTLKKYNRNHYMMENTTYIGTGRLHNVEMVDLGRYPGLISGSKSIVGEIYCVNDEKKKELDIFEEVGTLYDDKQAIIEVNEQEYLVHYYEMIPDGKTYPACLDKESYYRVDPNHFIWYIGEITCSYLKCETIENKNAYLIKKEDFIIIMHQKDNQFTCIGNNYDDVPIYKANA